MPQLDRNRSLYELVQLGFKGGRNAYDRKAVYRGLLGESRLAHSPAGTSLWRNVFYDTLLMIARKLMDGQRKQGRQEVVVGST